MASSNWSIWSIRRKANHPKAGGSRATDDCQQH
jgi:hypothetical protein